MILAHSVIIIFDIFIYWAELGKSKVLLNHQHIETSKINKSSYVPKLLMTIKIFLYFASVTSANMQLFEKYFICSYSSNKGGITVNSAKEVILLFDVLLFYFTIIGLSVFLFFTKCFSFRTIKERVGFSCNERYKIDFLQFA